MSDNPIDGGQGPLPVAAVAPPSAVDSAAGGGGLLAMIERLATKPDLNIDVFERLLAARRSEEDREAERSFNAAISLAKGELSPVLKTNVVDFTAKTGTRTKYRYESFSDVAKVVDPVFAQHGLSYRFSVIQQADMATVTCIVSHADGYRDTVSLQSKVDPGATGMSMVQALGSALTYLQRYSLRAAIGLAAGLDDDGRSAGGASPKITNAQADELRKMFDETGRSVSIVLTLVGVDEIEDMNLDQFNRAKGVLELARADQKARSHGPAGN